MTCKLPNYQLLVVNNVNNLLEPYCETDRAFQEVLVVKNLPAVQEM